MEEIVRDLAVTLRPEDEFTMAEEAEEMMCQCGTNCSTCTGTGTKACNKIVGDEALESLRTALREG